MIGSLLLSLFMSFIYPLIYASVAAVIKILFDQFTAPFNFSDGTNWFAQLLTPDLLNLVIKVMISAGVVLAVFLLAYNLFKLFFSGLSRRAESPFAICLRALLAIFLCYWIIDIVYIGVFPMFQWFLNMVKGITVNDFTTGYTGFINGLTGLVNITGQDNDFATYANAMNLGGYALEGNLFIVIWPIILIIFLIKTLMSMFKLVTEMAERYLLVNVLVISGPLVAPTIISNSTMEIFISWTRMLIANSLVLIFNTLGMIMMQAGFIVMGANVSTNSIGRAILWMVTYSALIKVIQKFDVYLAQLAFKIQAIGGDGKNRSVLGMLLMGASMAGRGNKFAATVAQEGGLKNHWNAARANVIGMFTNGYNNPRAAELKAPAEVEKGVAANAGKTIRDVTAGSPLAQAMFSAFVASHPDAVNDAAKMQEALQKFNAAVMETPEYQSGYDAKQAAQARLQAASLQNKDVFDAMRDKKIAENNFNTDLSGDADYIDSLKQLEMAQTMQKVDIKNDAEVQAAYAQAGEINRSIDNVRDSLSAYHRAPDDIKAARELVDNYNYAVQHGVAGVNGLVSEAEINKISADVSRAELQATREAENRAERKASLHSASTITASAKSTESQITVKDSSGNTTSAKRRSVTKNPNNRGGNGKK